MQENSTSNIITEDKVYKSQDKLFRDLLSDKKDIIKLINEILIKLNKNNQIKHKQLEKYNSNFINNQYKNREADIIYKIKGTNTFFLIEHQSYMDYTMPFRMLEYGMEITKSAINYAEMSKEEYKYPQILLIVLYTGDAKWKAQLEYQKKVEKIIENNENGINAKYTLIDIHNYKKEELLKSNCMIKNIMAIGQCKNKEEVKNTLEYIIDNTQDENNKIKLWKIIKYIIPKIIKKEDIEILLEKLEKTSYKKSIEN